MNLHASIELSWLRDFISLSTYEEQTACIQALQANSSYKEEAVLLTLAKCSAYNFREPFDNTTLPPLAAWWLDPRSKIQRDIVIQYLDSNKRLLDLDSKLEFAYSITGYPGAKRGVQGDFVISEPILTTGEKALNSNLTALSIQTWMPNHASNILHCLSPFWSRVYSKFDHTSNTIKLGIPVYGDMFEFFKDDAVAQHLLIYKGRPPRKEDGVALNTFAQQLHANPSQLPMPWPLYIELGLSPEAIYQAERTRENGMVSLNMNSLVSYVEGPAV